MRSPTRYEHVPWAKVYPHLRATWHQGEHVAIVGPTGCGKTTFESRMLDVRSYVVVFVTKVHDDTISQSFPGFRRITKWPPKVYENRVLLWPEVHKAKTIQDVYKMQRDVFTHALDRIFKERNWCVVFDEQHYMCKKLGLGLQNEMLLHQGRSSGLSVVNGTQRPAWVPVVTYSSATHAALWRTAHRDDLRKLAELGGLDSKELEHNILSLSKHEFVYVNTRQGDIMRSQVTL